MSYIYYPFVEMVAENVKQIRLRVEAACNKVNRKTDEVLLLAVGKTFSGSLIREAVESGVFDLAENYVQEFLKKKVELTDNRIRWHFIGHLQTNKVKYLIGNVDLVHSVDSIKLALEISKQASKINTTQNILVEVNASSETGKSGVNPESALSLTKEILQIPHLSFKGLMTVGKFTADGEESRKDFKTLKNLKTIFEKDGIPVEHLSMGMSNNFEVAIEEGATIIRLGTILFGSRAYDN
jgi:PLP dependent protein